MLALTKTSIAAAKASGTRELTRLLTLMAAGRLGGKTVLHVD